jgi:hypothetical protein
VKIDWHLSKWGGRAGLGPFIDYQDWDIWHHVLVLGLSFGPWEIGLIITLWHVEKAIKTLQSWGMSEKEAWGFCDRIRKSLPDPYHGNLKREIGKALAKMEVQHE